MNQTLKRGEHMADTEMLRYWVWLSMVFGAGSTRVQECLQHFDTPAEIYEALKAGRIPRVPPQVQKQVNACTLEQADSIVHYCRSNRITLLTQEDPAYPQLLETIYAPPFLLTAAGNLELLNKPLSLAIVGTRHPSPYSETVTDAMVTEVCKNDFLIVSGFAKGIDAAAHSAALRAGGSTIAVLGCGINVDYPRENARLREEMLSSGRGLFLSEYLPGTQPYPANFPKRNRILSGLAHATAVIEAAARSGSLVTADCAVEQGRYVFCVPPADLFDPRYAGVIPLLRDGAIPLMSPGDLLMAYYDRFPQYLTLGGGQPIKESERLVYLQEAKAAAPQKEKPQTAAKPSQPERETEPASAPQEQIPEKPTAGRTDLPDTEEGAQIVTYLRAHGGTDVDTLAEELDMDLSLLLSTLTLLELDDYVTSLFGKQYYPAD